MSEYYHTLKGRVQERYLEKITILGQDPYLLNINNCSTNLEHFPKIRYPDIVNYLLYIKNAYTFEEVKNYKSLEGYNQMICGWIKKLGVLPFGENILILGKVMHSQRLNEPMLSPWVVVKKDGLVVSAHCNCMAGLSETCSHVSALLFEIDHKTYNLEEITRTGRKAYWMAPGTSKSVDPKRLHDIDLRTAKRVYEDSHQERPLFVRQKKDLSQISMGKSEKEDFLRSILDTSSRGSVAHLVTPPFAGELKEYYDNRKKFFIMTRYSKENESKSLAELQATGAALDLSLTYDEVGNITAETLNQTKNRTWFSYRAGRITASNFKRCCRTNKDKPSISLIKGICYPSRLRLKAKAIHYGCSHEKEAIQDFVKLMSRTHPNFIYEKSGLFLNPRYPYFGASPDGIVECDCCGMGLIEIKCPYCARNSGVLEKIGEKKFFLKKINNEVVIDKDHAYYYQVQMQLALTKVKYNYLVAWSKKDIQYVKVQLDEQFWEVESKNAKDFFYNCILPEVLGKYYTRDEPPEVNATENGEENVDQQDLLVAITDEQLFFGEEIDLHEEIISMEEVVEEIHSIQ